MKKTFIIAAFLALSLTGCATPMAPLNFSVPNVGPSRHKINAELKAMTVTLARPDERTGDLPFGVEIITPMWKEALGEALDRMAIFKDGAAKKASLSVKILAVNMPAFGGDVETTATARYELLDRNSGAILYSETITSSGVVPFSHAFVGAVRGRESVNRAVQNNISKFLMALETVNVNKPLFPGRKR